MRKSLKWVVAVASVTGIALWMGRAGATPATTDPAFSGSTIAKGKFDRFSVRSHYEFPDGFGGPEGEDDDWTSMQKTTAASDLYVQSNVWQPGASTGWHTHPGHSLIIVTEGAITAYDESCQPEVFTPASSGGSGLVDANHVHMIRNNGAVVARATVVQLVPSGAPRRIDAPAPANCSP